MEAEMGIFDNVRCEYRLSPEGPWPAGFQTKAFDQPDVFSEYVISPNGDLRRECHEGLPVGPVDFTGSVDLWPLYGDTGFIVDFRAGKLVAFRSATLDEVMSL